MVGYNIQQGDFLSTVKHTLTELIVRNFVDVKKKAARRKNSRVSKRKNKATRDKSSISAIISNILTNLRINEFENKEKEPEDQEQSAQEEPEEENVVHGGYGTIKPYAGMPSYVKYTDYSKIWGHLGAFKTNDMYERDESSNEIAMRNGESTREMVSTGTIEKAAKYFKYFMWGEEMGGVGFVPPVGMNINSKDWEKYRLMSMMSIYQPLLRLKWSTA